MNGAYLGPEFSDKEIISMAKRFSGKYIFFEDYNKLCKEVATLLDKGKVVGWMQGRMEFGPRALGARSILGDPRNPEMQKKLNLKIKYRESFRPFAPSVLAELVDESPTAIVGSAFKNLGLMVTINQRLDFEQIKHPRNLLVQAAGT